MLVELAGQQVLVGLISLGLAIVIGIIGYRYYHHKSDNESGGQSAKIINISNRTKYRHKDFLRNRSQRLGVGLGCSLLFAVLAMSWTIYEKEFDIIACGFIIEDDEIDIVPRTEYIPPKIKLPPPVPVEIEAVEDDLIEEPDFEDVTVEDTDFFDDFIPEPSVKSTPAAPLPLPEEPDDGIIEIHKYVEQMPLFRSCDDKACSDKEILGFIYSRIKYPAIARENGIEGRVTAEFVIERDGKLSGIKVLRGIGAGCDQEVLKVLSMMNNGINWQPGKQNGKPVRVLFRIPITFDLSN